MLKDGKAPIAPHASNPIDTAVGGTVVGPVPLAKYDAGKYIVQLKVARPDPKKDLTQETPFEIVP